MEERRSLTFLEVFYNTLFEPIPEFQTLGGLSPMPNGLLWGAVGLIALVSLVNGLTWEGGLAVLPVQIILGLLGWVFVTGLIALIAYITRGDGRFKTLLVLTALADAPLIFLAPLALIQHLGGVWGFLAGVVTLLPVGWSFWLYALAIASTYGISLLRAFLLLLLPMIAVFFFFALLFATFWGFLFAALFGGR
jgi:hypothetical protein